MLNVLGTRITMLGLTGLILAVPALLTGCASTRPAETGVALDGYGPYNLKMGDPGPDFAYVSDQQQLVPFHRVRGRVTVVVFPNDADWPSAERAASFAQLADEYKGTARTLAIVSVGKMSSPCTETTAVAQSLSVKPGNFLLLCDPNGKIRDLYGPDAAGKIYVIDSENRILNVTPYTGVDSVRAAAIDGLQKYGARENDGWAEG